MDTCSIINLTKYYILEPVFSLEDILLFFYVHSNINMATVCNSAALTAIIILLFLTNFVCILPSLSHRLN